MPAGWGDAEVGLSGRPVSSPVTVRIGNRAMTTDYIVGPPGSEPLIGEVVPKVLDLTTDCTNGPLGPRHPDGPVLAFR